MCENNLSRNFSVHTLVAEAFLEKPNLEEKLVVNHKDGNKLNNDISNLEWCTVRENWLHARYVINTITNYGDHAFQRKPDKYSIEMVTAICEKLSERYYRADELIILLGLVNDPSNKKSEEYRTMKKFIKNIRQRRCWRCISDQYIWGE